MPHVRIHCQWKINVSKTIYIINIITIQTNICIHHADITMICTSIIECAHGTEGYKSNHEYHPEGKYTQMHAVYIKNVCAEMDMWFGHRRRYWCRSRLQICCTKRILVEWDGCTSQTHQSIFHSLPGNRSYTNPQNWVCVDFNKAVAETGHHNNFMDIVVFLA